MLLLSSEKTKGKKKIFSFLLFQLDYSGSFQNLRDSIMYSIAIILRTDKEHSHKLKIEPSMFYSWICDLVLDWNSN